MRLHDSEPFPTGHMRGGSFAWSAGKFICPGYVRKGLTVTCGVTFESNAGARAVRCEKCRVAHSREWFRLRSARRRKATV